MGNRNATHPLRWRFLASAHDGFALVKQSERDELDLSASVWVSKRKLLTHPHHQFRPNDPGRVMRAGLCRRVATAPRDMSADRVLAGHGLAPLADVADGQRCDRLPELVVGREHAVIAMPVLPRRWHKISEPVQELKRRELGASRSMSAIRTLASIENQLFSQLSMSAPAAASATGRRPSTWRHRNSRCRP